MAKLNPNDKLKIARIYANHMIRTGDTQQHTAYTYDVSASTVRSYLDCLKTSQLESDNSLYYQVEKQKRSRSWGFTDIRA